MQKKVEHVSAFQLYTPVERSGMDCSIENRNSPAGPKSLSRAVNRVTT